MVNKYFDRRIIPITNNNVPWLIFGAVVFLLFLVAVPAVNNLTSPVDVSRIERIVSNPESFKNRDTTVSGNINEVIGTRAFTVNDPDIIGNDNLLIISRQPLQAVGGGGDDLLYKENDRVTVSGPVRIFRIKEIEDDLGVDLDDDAFLQWEGRPALIVNSINSPN